MRRLLRFACVAWLALSAQAGHAQNYPAKPIRIIIPFPPGNTMDIMSRLIGPKLTERLGQNVIVDNRAGAAGQLGLEVAARAAPDGYTLVGGQGGNLVVAPHTYRKLPYDPLKDFTPIALGTTNFLALVVHPSVPFRSVKDLIAYARANPGKISFASNGEGGFPHMTIELLRTQGGFTYLHVPFKGSSEIATQLIGGHVDAAIDGYTGLSPHINSGRLKLLGITNPTRVPQMPDVPAIAESLPGYDSRGWFGWLGPAGMPRDIVVLLNQEINRAMQLPDVKEKLNAAGLIVVNEPPEFFAQVLKSDYEKYGKLIRAIGFQPQ
jgi:tripartite-type tricarboxylate transporter receptor subunit TctC